MTLERCAICEGSGSRNCPRCLGIGRLPDEKAPPADMECPECRGTGRVTCPGCMGTGYVDMPTFA